MVRNDRRHYIDGNEYFVRQFTVRYGRYDTETGIEGPEEDKWLYRATKWPPSCPPSLSAAVPPALPPVPPVEAAAEPAFQSTFKICYQVLTTRAFKVARGGVSVSLTGGWASRFADAATDCPTDAYDVTLHRKRLLFDDEISKATVPVGGQNVSWSPLEPGEYYFTIEAPSHSPFCCLRGDIAVSTFYAPMPSPLSDPMMA